MLEQIKQIVDYVQLKVNYSIKEAEETESVYLHVLRNKVRISTHLGHNNAADVQILIDRFNSKYCVIIGFSEILIFNSFRKVGDFLINYFFISSYETKLKNDLTDSRVELAQVKGTLSVTEKQVQLLQETPPDNTKKDYENRIRNLEESINKLDTYKKILRENEQKQTEYKQKISELIRQNADLKSDCQEAADLIQLLSTDPNVREMITNKEGKKYFLDNFPKDVQDVLKDIIKEYYDK